MHCRVSYVAILLFTSYSFLQGTLQDVGAEGCNGIDVLTIQNRLYPDQEDSERFAYKFSVSKGKKPDAPTIIFLPGGPGETSIIPIPKLTPELPTSYSVVRTDPRGVGCNDSLGQVDPYQAFSTEYLAADVLAIISHLKLTNYVLYGQSYGTHLATVVAAKSQSAGLNVPKAVVLEAIVGRALVPGERFHDGFLNQWEEVKVHLPLSIRKFLKEEALREHSSKEWGTYIAMMLMAGNIPNIGNMVERSLHSAAESANEGFKDMVRDPSNAQIKLYQFLVCRELTTQVSAPLMDAQLLLVNGEIVADDKSICDGLSVDRPYNSANWKVPSTIFYFQGEKDPDVIPGHARYHFENQSHVKRYFVSVPQGSHAALSSNLCDCSEEIWKEMTRDSSPDLDQALKKCSLKSLLTIEDGRFVGY